MRTAWKASNAASTARVPQHCGLMYAKGRAVRALDADDRCGGGPFGEPGGGLDGKCIRTAGYHAGEGGVCPCPWVTRVPCWASGRGLCAPARGHHRDGRSAGIRLAEGRRGPEPGPARERLGRGRMELAMALRSYVNGSWTSPSAEGVPLLDAVTGEQVATISSVGVDMRAALEYGRAVGGPALRELTFHQR